MRSLENGCEERSERFRRPFAWCYPAEQELHLQVQRVMRTLSIPSGNVFLASDRQRPSVDAMLESEFGAKSVPDGLLPHDSGAAVLVDAYIAMRSDAFIGSAFSSLSGIVRVHRLYVGGFPAGTNFPYADAGQPWPDAIDHIFL